MMRPSKRVDGFVELDIFSQQEKQQTPRIPKREDWGTLGNIREDW